MHEYTPDQLHFVESFTVKRDTLTLEVGLLTHEKEELMKKNQELSDINASLQKGIDEMNENASKIGFEQAEKINTLRLEETALKAELETLRNQKDTLKKELDEKNNTLITLGVLIKSIQSATEDTTNQIKQMSNQINLYTGKVESASISINHESERIKSFTDELANVIDKERKANYEKSREIDNRELAVIGREKLAEMKYQEVVKSMNK